MQTLVALATALLLSAAAAPVAGAQTTTTLGTGGGGSPHVRSTWQVGGANIALEYGRPSLKGRSESQMMPAGKPWRSGADQATVLTTDRALTFGQLTLPAGQYTINTEPGESGWQLLFGRLEKAGQWGVPYLPKLEIGRTPMSLARAKAPAEQVTFTIDPTGNGGVLRLEWGTTSVSAPFTVGK
jgi:hypothetical protein